MTGLLLLSMLDAPGVRYETFFSVAAGASAVWLFPAAGVPFIIVGALLVYNRRTIAEYEPPAFSGAAAFYRVFPWAFLGFAVLWTATAFGQAYAQHRYFTGLLESGTVTVVEGRVENFVPMAPTGHPPETFTVGNQRFVYSDYVVTGGFNWSASRGGPIREGLYVRIAHVDGTILQLEIRKE